MKKASFIARIVFAIALLAILYRFALNGRYHYVANSQYAIDKWTNTVSQPKNWDSFLKEVAQEESARQEQPLSFETQEENVEETEEYE